MSIQQIDFPAAQYIIKRQIVKFSEMMNKKIWGDAYAQIGAYCKEQAIEPQSPPMTLYLVWDEENQRTEMAPAFHVKDVESVDVEGLELYSVGDSKALKLEYRGDYSGLRAAHESLMRYIQDSNLIFGDLVIEEYVTDPGKEPNSNKWLTNIYYLLK